MFSERSNAPERQADWIPLGRVSYRDAWARQRRVHEERAEGRVPDTVITAEHDPVFTFGRTARDEDLLASTEAVRAAGIEICRVERGGGITYHGPGQVVIYPIVDLRSYGRDIRGYVSGLEEATIAALGRFGVSAERRLGLPGVWVGDDKIASIGVFVQRWVTRHGLAVNVAVDERHFRMIRPCGLPVRAISIAEVVPSAPDLPAVEAALLEELARRFRWRLVPATAGEGKR